MVLARWLQAVSQCLPEDREEHVTETVIPAEERKGLERELEARIERATRLHLEGHVRYEQFAEEKQRAQAGLADLRPAPANYPATSGGAFPPGRNRDTSEQPFLPSTLSLLGSDVLPDQVRGTMIPGRSNIVAIGPQLPPHK